MKPKVLAILPAFIPSTIIDVTTPLIDMHRANLIHARITLEIFVSRKDVSWSDVVILCRNTEPATAEWFLQVLELGKPYIYDIDDNFFELSSAGVLGEYHTSPDRLELLREYIRLAQLVRVYSEPLRERAAGINPAVYKVVAAIDRRMIAPAQTSGRDGTIKIVYATSRIIDPLAEVFAPALKQILADYPNRVRAYLLGCKPPDFRDVPNVIFRPMEFNYRSYLRSFSSANYDIGLAPLLDDVFHRSKTNNKFREYAACRIAGVYSDVDVYSTCVVDGETGLLVRNDASAWYAAIRRLIVDADERERIKQRAHEFVIRNYSQEAFADLWYQQIMRVTNRPAGGRQLSVVAEKLIESYSKRSWLERTGLAGWLVPLGAGLTAINRARWVLQKSTNMLRRAGTYGLSYAFDKLRHYVSTIWTLYEIRLRLFIERHLKP